MRVYTKDKVICDPSALSKTLHTRYLKFQGNITNPIEGKPTFLSQIYLKFLFYFGVHLQRLLGGMHLYGKFWNI